MSVITAGLPMAADPATIEAAARGLVEVNRLLLRRARQRGRPIPALYKAGVRYRREPTGQESWDTIDRVLARGYGDCEDLAAWRAAELVESGGDPGARVAIIRTGPKTMHAVVRRSNGSTEDPSRRLGMGQADPGYLTELGADPGQIAYRIERVPGAWVVRVYAPTSGLPPAFGIARDHAMLPPWTSPAMVQAVKAAAAKPAAAPAVKAAVKKAKRKGKKGAMSFVRRHAGKVLKTAAATAANSFVPGAGALVSAALT